MFSDFYGNQTEEQFAEEYIGNSVSSHMSVDDDFLIAPPSAPRHSQDGYSSLNDSASSWNEEIF
jgi:hypothetical protein